MATISGDSRHASYAAAAAAARRPKTPYGAELATRRRETESRLGPALHSHDTAAARGATPAALASRNGTPSRANPRQRSRISPQSSPPKLQRTPCEEDALDDAAATLLSELQQAVVDVSRHLVGERHRAAGQREQIFALEAVVAEQDAMLCSLRAEHEALQRERGELLSQYQHALRTRGGAGPASPTPAAHPPHASRRRTISAAEVDSCIRAEFCRCAAAYESAPSRAFDEASPIVATVLRALAAQLLELKVASHSTTPVSGTPQPSPAQQNAMVTSSGSPPPPPPATRHCVDAAPPATRQSVTSAAATHTSGAPPPEPPADGRRFYRPLDAASGSAVVNGGHIGSSLKTAPSSRGHAGVRAASEASGSISSSVYDDAASILSEIRARYGLDDSVA